MQRFKFSTITAICLILSGCATWSTGTVQQSDHRLGIAPQQTVAGNITLTEGDITDRKYVSLGDISVTVNKTTIFNSDPTKDQVDEKLRERAAQLGADAVILVRYGNGGVSLLSWGSLEGRGRAVKYQP